MASLRKAINEKCKDCIYDPIGGNGTWLKQVADCTAVTCPIHTVRPTPRDRSIKEESLILARERGQFDPKPDSFGHRQ